MRLEPGDLMRLTIDAILTPADVQTPNVRVTYGRRGDIVVLVKPFRTTTEHLIMHPTLGLREVFGGSVKRVGKR